MIGAASALARAIISDKFLQNAINKHIGDDDMTSFLESLLKRSDEERLNGWIKKENSLANSFRDKTGLSGNISMSAESPQIREEMSTASKVGGASVAAVAGSTAILAAGWHTLSWAMSGLFIWAMPAAVLFTGIMSAVSKDSEYNKLMKSVDDEEPKYIERINEYLIYRIIPEIESDNNKLCREIKNGAFSKRIGSFEPEILDQLIFKLEDYINLLRIKAEEIFFEKRGNLSSWLLKADNYLKDGDNVTAAIVSSHAFEDFLHQLNMKFGLKFNFRQQAHNQIFIDYIADNSLIKEEHRGLLHSLRDRRNNFTHRIHLFSMWNKNRKVKEITTFMNDVNLLFECYV